MLFDIGKLGKAALAIFAHEYMTSLACIYLLLPRVVLLLELSNHRLHVIRASTLEHVASR